MTEFTSGQLRIDTQTSAHDLLVTWRGRSVARDPSAFIWPVLQHVLAQANGKRVILDFCHMEYMNSSTLTPLVRMMEQAKRDNVSVSLRYDSKLKWQALAFSVPELMGTHT